MSFVILFYGCFGFYGVTVQVNEFPPLYVQVSVTLNTISMLPRTNTAPFCIVIVSPTLNVIPMLTFSIVNVVRK